MSTKFQIYNIKMQNRGHKSKHKDLSILLILLLVLFPEYFSITLY